MPNKMMTMRKINDTYYRNNDGDYVRRFPQDIEEGTWTICIDDEITVITGDMKDAIKTFASIVEKGAKK